MSEEGVVTRSQGVHGSGGRGYSPAQYAAVVEAVKRVGGYGEALTVERISDATGIAGRTVREVLSAADGVDVLLGGDGQGYRLAADPSDAERLTLRYESQLRRMAERVERRRAWSRWSDA